jgi:hypothetical protein
MTLRDARFSSVVIETTRAKSSSPKAHATLAAPASLAMPRFHQRGSSAQPTSGS